MTGLRFQSSYLIHGVPLRVGSDIRSVHEAIEDRLSRFRCDEPLPPGALSFEYRAAGGARSSHPQWRSGELLSSTARKGNLDPAPAGLDLDVYRQDGCLLYDLHEKGRVVLDIAGGRLSGYLASDAHLGPAFATTYLVLLPLREALKRRGLFSVHASAVEKDGRGVLFPAYSGSGKTTSCLALLGGGFRSLSDDRPFLRRRDGADLVEVLAFPDSFHVTDFTVRMFPELQDVVRSAALSAGRKHRVDPERVYPACTGIEAVAKLIVFPRLSDRPDCVAVPLPKGVALQELLPHSLLVFDPEAAARQFDLLGDLIAQVDCYRLFLGRNPRELPPLIEHLLERRDRNAGCGPYPGEVRRGS